jgi:hypothetical protein
MQPVAAPMYRHKKTTQEYEALGTYSCIKEREFPRERYLQSGRLRKVSAEPLFLSSDGYFTPSGTDHGPLIFYRGRAGAFVRLPEDFEDTFYPINGQET